MQTDSRLVQNVDRLRQFATGFADVILDLGEFSDKLNALRFSAGKGGGLLPERQIAEPDFLASA